MSDLKTQSQIVTEKLKEASVSALNQAESKAGSDITSIATDALGEVKNAVGSITNVVNSAKKQLNAIQGVVATVKNVVSTVQNIGKSFSSSANLKQIGQSVLGTVLSQTLNKTSIGKQNIPSIIVQKNTEENIKKLLYRS